ncbi:MAG: amidohydrolase [Gemmatimonadaceae bacterium]|nr:amidohydrolase [Gemmatimonadaceae bacterium]
MTTASERARQRALGAFSPAEREVVVALRRDLHQHPELSWQEQRTAARLEKALRDLGLGDIRRVARTGVVARIPGRRSDAPVVAIRGDIDALPIQEETGLAFASTVDGVMHACGHDVHASWAVAAAMRLLAEPAAGDVLVVLQPAEEVGAGAFAILESGALDGVAAIFGGHVDRRFAVGEVVVEPGPLAASADSFSIEIIGQGAHGARPHEAADPIVAGAAIVAALQTIVARRVDPAAPAVVSVGSFHAGVAANVIPERATLTGTLRAMDPVTRQRLLDEVARISVAVGEAHGVNVAARVERGTPPIVNTPREAEWARAAAASALGSDAVVPFGITNMGGEDFAFYMERIPGCFMRIGARETGGERIAAHSPRFHASEDAIFVGAALLAECARTASRELLAAR